MRKVLAALDNSLAAQAVLATASNLAHAFDGEVEALHVVEDGDRIACDEAEAAGLQLRRVTGATVPALVSAAEAPDVQVLVVGTRRFPVEGHPVGGTALEVITSLPKPVVVVPPDGSQRSLRRVLVPLEGTRSTSLAPKAIIELSREANVEVVVLHVQDAATVPAFTDQPQHQAAAWGQEFVARYCPWGIGSVTLELRVGRRAEQILAVAESHDCDLIALGWSQEVAAGRALVVREVLERGRLPVLLVPVVLSAGADKPKEEIWSRSQSSLV